MERKVYPLRLPKKTYDLAVSLAERTGISVNALFTMAIEENLERRLLRQDAYRLLPKDKVSPLVEKPPVAPQKRFDAPSGGRNAPCPCGSGKKWKVCHMK